MCSSLALKTVKRCRKFHNFVLVSFYCLLLKTVWYEMASHLLQFYLKFCLPKVLMVPPSLLYYHHIVCFLAKLQSEVQQISDVIKLPKALHHNKLLHCNCTNYVWLDMLMVSMSLFEHLSNIYALSKTHLRLHKDIYTH